MDKIRKPEILAPAGTYEAMEAAVKAGCDAVYAGGSFFSARAYAGNFDEAAFLKAIDYCHLFGVKVYMTLNTLLKEEELGQSVKGDPAFRQGANIIAYLAPYYRAGLDAVLVQDVGVLKLLRDHFPDLPVHASTQLSIASSYGAEFAKELGFGRIVPARELSLEEIRSIKQKVNIEIEAFVHGAMCFAYSGKCLFSSFAGGRSGNRGKCAQPCRKCYELFESVQAPHTKALAGRGRNRKAAEDRIGSQAEPPEHLAREYLMSLKDLCTLQELPLLIDAGVDSFKIEGRMKNPWYVALTVRAYRRARDLYLYLRETEGAEDFGSLSGQAKAEYAGSMESDFEDLQDIYNRGGFYSGYYFTEKGKEMAALKRPNHQGLRVGTVLSVKPPQIAVKLERDIHRGDVLEFREKETAGVLPGSEEGAELTCGTDGDAGCEVCLKGKEFKKIKPGMEVWRTRNEELLGRIKAEILNSEKAVPVSCLIRAQVGKPLQITLAEEAEKKAGSRAAVCVEGEPVEASSHAPVTAEILTDKIKKSRGSHLEISRVVCEIDENAFVRMSSFNALRRKAAEQLKEQIAEAYRRQSRNTGC